MGTVNLLLKVDKELLSTILPEHGLLENYRSWNVTTPAGRGKYYFILLFTSTAGVSVP